MASELVSLTMSETTLTSTSVGLPIGGQTKLRYRRPVEVWGVF